MWDKIRRDWEKKDVTFADLEKKYGVKAATIRSRKSREGWIKGGVATKYKSTLPVATEPIEDATKYIVDETSLEDSGLNDRQQLFCIHYIENFNATQAYMKAYGVKRTVAMVNGSRLLSHAKVRSVIRRLKKERASAALLSADDVLQMYIDIAFADITDVIDFQQVETTITEIEETVDKGGKKKVIKREVPYTYTKFVMQYAEDVNGRIITELARGKDGMFRVKLADKMKALEWLSDYMDIKGDRRFNQKVQEERLKIQRAQTEIMATEDKTNNAYRDLSTEDLMKLARGDEDENSN